MSAIATDPEVLFAAARSGDRVSLARLLSLVERGGPTSRAVAAIAYSASPAFSIGLTGAPGAGKSTLTDRLIGEFVTASTSQAEPNIAVLAVDPSSPFTGGAILGDRIRMQSHATDPSVFIRSFATRGHLGGLALAVPDAVRVFGAVEVSLVIIETVGVGQMEVEVASTADTTVVVVNPGWGDGVQANKAGLLEVADLFIINKCDRDGVAETRRDLEAMLDLAAVSDWRPPIVETTATDGQGLDGVMEALASHRSFLESTGELARRRHRRIEHELRQILVALIQARVGERTGEAGFAEVVARIEAGSIDPYRAAESLLEAN